MTLQHITCDSPAAVGAMEIISSKPGITTLEMAKRGGWSVYYMRAVLRYLRKHGRVKSNKRHRDCCWWLKS